MAFIAESRANGSRPLRPVSPSPSVDLTRENSRKRKRTKPASTFEKEAAEARRKILGDNFPCGVLPPGKADAEETREDSSTTALRSSHIMTASQEEARNMILGISRPAKPCPGPSLDPADPYHYDEDTLSASQDEARRRIVFDVTQMSLNSTSRRSQERDPISRSLREQSKIPDKVLTGSYFRLQVQQLVSQHNVQDGILPIRADRRFTLPDLMSNTDLCRTADRIVGNTSLVAPRSTRSLFEAAVRTMMQEGYILLAPQIDHPSRERQDSYIKASPEYLQEFVQQVAGPTLRRWRSMNTSSIIDGILARLRILDDRFRYLNRETISDTWTLLQRKSV